MAGVSHLTSIKSRVQKIRETEGLISQSLPDYEDWIERRARDIDTPRQLVGAIGSGALLGLSAGGLGFSLVGKSAMYFTGSSAVGVGFSALSFPRAIFPSTSYQAYAQAENEYALKYADKISELEAMAEQLIPEDEQAKAREQWGADWYKYFAKELLEARYGLSGLYEIPVPINKEPQAVSDWYGVPRPVVTEGQMSLGEYLDKGLPVADIDLTKILDRW